MMELFVLANGNSKIGMGHVFRSLTLVKELKRIGVESTYLSFDNDEMANQEIENFARLVKMTYSHELLDSPKLFLEAISKMKNRHSTALLYIDSDIRDFYLESYQKSIIQSGVKLMYATLFNNVHYYAHILLNQNILALYQEYSTEDYTKRLLGPKYFLWSNAAQKMKAKQQIGLNEEINPFINFGNADPNNLTEKIVELIALKIESFKKVNVVVGELYSHYERLKIQIDKISGGKIVLHRNVKNMYALMGECNLGISSMGLTFWELNYLEIPTLILSGSDRERPVCEFVDDKRYGFRIGDFKDENWRLNWFEKLDVFIKEKSYLTLRNLELKEMVNIKGVELVARQMVTICDKKRSV